MKSLKKYLLLAIIFITPVLSALNLTLSWNASPDITVAGYTLYQGSISGVYNTNFNAGNNFSLTVSNLNAKSNYYFIATSYDIAGLESIASNEASYIGTNIFYVSEIKYGTSINSLTSTSYNVLDYQSSLPSQIKGVSLIVSKLPSRNMQISMKISYTNVNILAFTNIPVIIRTNPPKNEFYQGKLIVTNKWP